MKTILIRVGIDNEYGNWNAPLDLNSGRFVYVPIPEEQEPQPSLVRTYDEIPPALQRFSGDIGLDYNLCPTLPQPLLGRPMHLDPDFERLTYGDNAPRIAKLKTFEKDDVVVFYSSFLPIGVRRGTSYALSYALIGLYVIDEIVRAKDVPVDRWSENAHTRKVKIGKSDIIVRAQKGKSGRFERAIPIGEWRSRAYRVKNETLKLWGGLKVKNGYIQRSVSPPPFLNSAQFYEWFIKQEVALCERNN